MSNRTYICTECRTTRRGSYGAWLPTVFRCRNCSGPLWELSARWRIPKSTDVKGWNELLEMVARQRPCREKILRCQGQHHLREIDRRVAHYSVRKPSKKRDDALEDLEKQRTRVMRCYFGVKPCAK